MGVQNLNTLKGWFETQDEPTQEQFWDFLDSFFHKTDKIAYANLTPELQALINTLPTPVQVATLSADGSVVIPNDCEVWLITLRSEIGGDTIKYTTISLSPGTYIDEGLAIVANKTKHSHQIFSMTAGASILFEGITHLTTIKIYKA